MIKRGAQSGGDVPLQTIEARASDCITLKSYPNGSDQIQRVAVNYGFWGIPETFLLDPEGNYQSVK